METYVADTHAMVWYTEDDSRLGKSARLIMDGTRSGGVILLLSVMSLMEMDYLGRKHRIDPALPRLLKQRAEPDAALRIVSIDMPVYEKFLHVPTDAVPELPDRIIVATALAHKAKLITKDHIIQRWSPDLCVW